MAHVDTLVLFADDELEPTEMMAEEEEEERPLDSTIPAVLLTKEERRRIKNQKKSQKRKEKNAERNRKNAELIAAGLKTKRDVAEENVRRHLEGIISRERGRLRQEAEAEIERRLQEWKEKVERGEIDINRRLSVKKADKRQQGQKEHQRRRRADRQAMRRSLNYGWAAVGRAMVLGSESEVPSLMDTEIRMEDQIDHPPPIATIAPRVEDIIPLKWWRN